LHQFVLVNIASSFFQLHLKWVQTSWPGILLPRGALLSV